MLPVVPGAFIFFMKKGYFPLFLVSTFGRYLFLSSHLAPYQMHEQTEQLTINCPLVICSLGCALVCPGESFYTVKAVVYIWFRWFEVN